ncbi:MAG: hypothetical protein B6244_10820 [Candidatus Cloacimonetes bacterium 4572_55]|nr:MAG: hypothetical protein B6244_10820 [Candidatus Cloacimonetes bacterium 4572_55]
MQRTLISLCFVFITITIANANSLVAKCPERPLQIQILPENSVTIGEPFTLKIELSTKVDVKHIEFQLEASSKIQWFPNASLSKDLRANTKSVLEIGEIEISEPGQYKVEVIAVGSSVDGLGISMNDFLIIDIHGSIGQMSSMKDYVEIDIPSRIPLLSVAPQNEILLNNARITDGLAADPVEPELAYFNDDYLFDESERDGSTERSGTFTATGQLFYQHPEDAPGTYRHMPRRSERITTKCTRFWSSLCSARNS